MSFGNILIRLFEMSTDNNEGSMVPIVPDEMVLRLLNDRSSEVS